MPKWSRVREGEEGVGEREVMVVPRWSCEVGMGLARRLTSSSTPLAET